MNITDLTPGTRVRLIRGTGHYSPAGTTGTVLDPSGTSLLGFEALVLLDGDEIGSTVWMAADLEPTTQTIPVPA